MKRPDYLNLSPDERRVLAQPDADKSQKADSDPLQIPLVLGQTAKDTNHIRPRVVCDSCGLDRIESPSAIAGGMSYRRCPACGSQCRTVETWE